MATAVGLDIGTNAIKIAEVRRSRQGLSLVKLGRRATPVGAIKSGVIVKQKEVAAEITGLLRELRIRPRNVVTAVAGQSVIVRTLMLPPMSREEMAEAVRWEVESQLPYPVDEGVYDFDIIGEVRVQDSEQPQLKIGLVAARKEIVNSYVDTLRLCRIAPQIVDVQPFAIMRSLSMQECASRILGIAHDAGYGQAAPEFPSMDDVERMSLDDLRSLATELDSGADQAMPPRRVGGAAGYEAAATLDADRAEADSDREACLVVLDIGAGTTDVVVHSGDESTFTRIIPVGGEAITTAIADAVFCSREEAESLKRTVDWVAGVDSQTGQPAEPAAVSAIQGVVADLAREIRRTIDFYNADQGDKLIRGGVLVGGGAKLMGLVEYLSDQLDLPMILGDPFARVHVSKQRLDTSSLREDAPIMAVSVGLAVRGVEEP